METLKNLKGLLEESGFSPDLKARTKIDALKELAGLLVETGGLAADAKDSLFEALLEREGKMSTGMEFGVAIPHAKTDKTDHLITAVAICKDGVDFKSLDGRPSNIFVATVSPPSDAGAHIKFIADISRHLASRSVRERLLEATTADEMISAFFGDGTVQ